MFEYELQQEIERHYRLEPHHPEFERYSGFINILDVQEMAIDRLSRNVCKNNGLINEGEMTKYLPQFVDDEESLSHLENYKLFVNTMADKVKQIYHDVISDDVR
jgi:hypothetical protein